MVAKVYIKRTDRNNAPPFGLQPGELSVEMGIPTRLWVGVPVSLDPTGRKQLTPSESNVLVQEGPPQFPVQGQLWYESDTGILWMRYEDVNSAQWVQVNGVAVAGSGATVADIPPSAPSQGTLWWESDTGTLWIWMDDGNSAQWVQAAGSTGSGEGGSGGTTDAYTRAESDATNATQDANINNRVLRTGDTMTGPLVGTAITAADFSSTGGGFIGKSANPTIFGSNGTSVILRPNITTGAGDVVINPAGNINAASLTISGSINAVGAINSSGTITGAGLVSTGTVTGNQVVANAGLVSNGAFTCYGYSTLTGMTSNGNIIANNAGIIIGRATLAGYNSIYGQTGGANRWAIALGDNDPSDSFRLVRFSDSGGESIVISANRGSGDVTVYGNMRTAAAIGAGTGFMAKPGSGGAESGHVFNIDWNAQSIPDLWINTTRVGQISLISDYRVKKDVAPLPSMWETVKALKPISYTQAGWTPMARAGEPPPTPLFLANDIEQWGFIAHELQETLVPSAASGEKDAENSIQCPNPFTVIAALTKALQEALAEIEAIKAHVGMS